MFKFKIESFEKETPERLCELLKKNPGALESEEEMTVLTQFVMRRSESVVVQKNFCSALRHMCSRGNDATLQRITNAGCLQTILGAMDRHRAEPQLHAYGFEVIAAIARQDPINALLQISSVDGVRVIVSSLGAFPRDTKVEVPGLGMLAALARDFEIAQSVLDYGGVEIVKGVIRDNMKVTSVLLQALATLTNIVAVDEDGALGGSVGEEVVCSLGVDLLTELATTYNVPDVPLPSGGSLCSPRSGAPSSNLSDSKQNAAGSGDNGLNSENVAVLSAVVKLIAISLSTRHKQIQNNDENDGDDDKEESATIVSDKDKKESVNKEEDKKESVNKEDKKEGIDKGNTPIVIDDDDDDEEDDSDDDRGVATTNKAVCDICHNSLLRQLLIMLRSAVTPPEIQRWACLAVGAMGYGTPANCAKIIRTGCLDALLDLVRQRKSGGPIGGGIDGDGVIDTATEALAGLALTPAVAAAVRVRMGVPLLLETMWGWRGAATVQANACLCLGALARDPRTSGEIGYSGGIRHIASALHTHKDAAPVQKACLLALTYLALNPANRYIIASAEKAIRAILTTMRRFRNSLATQIFAASALANLTAGSGGNGNGGSDGDEGADDDAGTAGSSAASIAEEIMDGGAAELVTTAMAAYPKSASLQESCARLLGNIACSKRAVAERIALPGGCDALVQTLQGFSGRRGAPARRAVTAALTALANIAAAPSKAACERMCDAGLPSALIRAALAHAAAPATQRAALRLAAGALAVGSGVRSKLRKAGIVHPALAALTAFPGDAEVQYEGARVVAALAGGSSSSVRDDLLDGAAVATLTSAIRMFPEDIETVKQCCSALRSLVEATADNVPRMLRDGLSLPGLVTVLESYARYMCPQYQAPAAAVAAALSIIKSCCAVITGAALYAEGVAAAAIEAGAVKALLECMEAGRDTQDVQEWTMLALAALLATDEARALCDEQEVAAAAEEPLIRFGHSSKKVRDFARAILRVEDKRGDAMKKSGECCSCEWVEGDHGGKHCKQKDGRYCKVCSYPQVLYACKTCQKPDQRLHLYCEYCWENNHDGHTGIKMFFAGKCETPQK